MSTLVKLKDLNIHKHDFLRIICYKGFQMLRPAKQLRKATNFGINIFLTLAAVTQIPEGVVIGFLTHVDEGPRKGSREGPSSALSKNCLLIILITAI